MSKIKFNLVSLEQALAFQVIHMDKRFLNCEYVACNGLQIKSTNCSHITDLGIIYLQGTVEVNDLNVSALYFKSNEERNIYKNKIVEALKDWADNWDGWLDKKDNILKQFEF